MKSTKPLNWLAWIACLCSFSAFAAEEMAIVRDGRVNVRGQPSLIGEVITQLQQGDKVVVLEEITHAKAKTNEPPKWARIQMPSNTPVWVYAPFLDLATKTVKVSRLNLRAGPGENYSVVGRLERGAAVTEIRRVEDWLEIETPPGAYAYVAADLLIKTTGASLAGAAPSQPAPLALPPTAAPVRPPETTATPTPGPTATPAPIQTTLPSQTTRPTAQVPPAPVVQAEDAPPVTPASTSPAAAPVAAPAPPTVTTAPVVVAAASTPTTAAAAVSSPKAEEPQPRRVVRREGLVRSTVSIQAPTYYELLNPENRKTINYLHTDKLGLNLKDYRGRRIVVTGEEALDPRWPRTPVIEVDRLELIP